MLDDPLLDVVEPVVVGVEDGAGGHEVGGVGRGDVPGQLEDGVEPGPDPLRLGVLLAGPLQLVDLAQQRLAHGVRDVGGLRPGAVVIGTLGLALAELLADRRELLAQEVLPLGLVDALPDVLADLLADLELGQVVLGPPDQPLEPRLGLGGLEELPLALGRQVRRVAGRVGDDGGVGQAAEGVDDLPRLPVLEHRHDQRLVVGRELGRALAGGLVGHRRGLDPQRRAGSGDAVADQGATPGAQHGGGRSAAEPADPVDGRDHAVRRVAVVAARGHQELVAPLAAGGVDGGLGGLVELDRDDHAGEQHGVGEEQHGESQRLGHRAPTSES